MSRIARPIKECLRRTLVLFVGALGLMILGGCVNHEEGDRPGEAQAREPISTPVETASVNILGSHPSPTGEEESAEATGQELIQVVQPVTVGVRVGGA